MLRSLDSVLFLTISLFTTATILYLPDHLMTMSRRAYYYCAGDSSSASAAASLSRQAVGTATGWAQNAYAVAMNRSVEAAAAVTGEALAGMAGE